MPHELERFHQLLITFARDHADAIAVQDETQRFTFRQLLAEVGLRTHNLDARSPGTLVLALDNGPQLLFWDLAALFSQRPCVIVPSFFSAAQFSHCIEQSGASHVLCDPQW
ncbi:AMP-binding protein, partial [Leclercia adecarboxylata]